MRAKLIVEIDGSQHGMPSGRQEDIIRDEAPAAKGFAVLRFWNIDVDRSVVAVIDTIVNEATLMLRDPR